MSLPSQPRVTAPVASREERRWVSVLFADISAFSALSERLDPEDVKAFADRCVERMSAEVGRFGGTVLRIIGDEVLAVFGAPVAHEDDAERAVRAALAMRDLDLSDDIHQDIQVHVGVNTGEAMTGMSGPAEARDYTVHGDMVNTAARLRTAAAAGTVLVGEETFQETRHTIEYREVAPFAAKGKEKPVRAFEALAAIAEPGRRPKGNVPLIGRDDELERLLNMWRYVLRDQQPHLVTILGDPGIGKSRLAAEFEARLPAGTAIWHGRCPSYGAAPAYQPFTMALREAAGVEVGEAPEATRAKLGALVAAGIGPEDEPEAVARHLALLTGLELPTDRGAGTVDQHQLHGSARRFLEGFARRRPLCLIFDDLQWADDAFLDLLESTAARAREASLLIVTQARPQFGERRPNWGRSVQSFTSLPLRPLGEQMEADLIAALIEQHGLPAEIAERIGRSAGGNALFAEEMVAMIAEGGLATDVPPVIKLLIAARLDSLPLAERRAMQLASIFGQAFWKCGLQALDEGDDAAEALEGLRLKDLVRDVPRSQLPGEEEYAFKHDLIRDVAYEMLPKAERRRLHGRATGWLEQVGRDRLEAFYDQLAYHALQSGQLKLAVNYLRLGAERALQAAANRQAIALLSQAIELAQEPALSVELSDLLALRGRAHIGVAQWAEAVPDVQAALERLLPERVTERAQLLLDLANARFWIFDMDGVRRYASEALDLAKQIGRHDLMFTALAIFASVESSNGNLLDGVALLEKAATDYGPYSLPPTPTLGGLYYWLGRLEEAVAHNRADLEEAEGDTSRTLTSLPQLGLALAGSGRYGEAEAAFQEGRRLGLEHEIWPLLARSIAMSAGYHLDLFDYAGHEAIAQEARELARSVDFIPTQVSANIDLLLNYARRGEAAAAAALLPGVAVQVEKAAGFHGWLWRLRLAEARAELALAEGKWSEAIELADDAVRQSQLRGRVKYQALGLRSRALGLKGIGRAREAIGELHQAVELARPTGDPALLVQVAAPLLALAGDDVLLAEVQGAVGRILTTVPNDEVRRAFLVAEPVQRLVKS